MNDIFKKDIDFDKYIVFKRKDVEKYTCGLSFLKELSELISEKRKNDNKKPENKYIVINTDEPYIDEVIKILKKDFFDKQKEYLKSLCNNGGTYEQF